MGTGIFRVQRRVDEWLPVGHAVGLVVTLEISVTDGSDWAPEIVRVLGIEHRDVGIRCSHFRQSEQACILQQHSSAARGELADDRLPGGGTHHRPEACYLRLLGRPQRALVPAQVFNLVIVPDPLPAGQLGGAELGEIASRAP